MKRVFSIILFLTFTMPDCRAQKSDKEPTGEVSKNDIKCILKFSPLGLIPLEGLGYPLFSYEKIFRKRKTLQINTTFNYFSNDGLFTNNLGVGIEYRKYYSKKKSAPQGKYLAFGFGGNLLTNNTYNGSVVKTTSFSGKFVLGRQWIYNSKFTIDFNGGITYVAPNFKINTIPQTQHVSGPLPAINISLGYIFK